MDEADWLIVGAGFTGLTFAERIANKLGDRVLLIDRRDHLAGNAHDEHNEHGHLVHSYGPHIFHTNSPLVWDYLSQFTDWRPHVLYVNAVIDGTLVPLPFNFVSIDKLFPAASAKKLQTLLTETYGLGTRLPILQLRQSADPALKMLGDLVYEKVFLNYTVKQWDQRPEDLDRSVVARVPIVVGDDCRYFTDRYQAMPVAGYTEMAHRMVSSSNITVSLNTSYEDIARPHRFKRVIFTGAVDEYFGACFGHLPYRSMRFEFWSDPRNRVQDSAIYTYPNGCAHTRITEFKHMNPSDAPGSTLCREFPGPHIPGVNRADYPIPKEENRLLYRLYAEAADKIRDRVLFAGRLGKYSYYNIDQAVAGALAAFESGI